MYERPQLVGILDSDRRLDSTRNIYDIRQKAAHDLAHVTRFTTTCDEHTPCCQQRTGQLPVPRATGAASLVCRPGVEHDRVRPVVGPRDLIVFDLQHLHHRPAGLEARYFRAVQLQHVQVDEIGNLPDLAGVLVDENSDDLRANRKAVDDGLCLLGCDAPLGGAEMESEQVRPGLDRRRRAGSVTDPADLYPDHAVSSLIFCAGSSERMSVSPTRIASAPAS